MNQAEQATASAEQSQSTTFDDEENSNVEKVVDKQDSGVKEEDDESSSSSSTGDDNIALPLDQLPPNNNYLRQIPASPEPGESSSNEEDRALMEQAKVQLEEISAQLSEQQHIAHEEEEFPIMEEMEEEEEQSRELQIGDHVYQWRSWAGIPGVFQHHGIVMNKEQVEEEDEQGQVKTITKLTIADFSNIPGTSGKAASASASPGTKSPDKVATSDETKEENDSSSVEADRETDLSPTAAKSINNTPSRKSLFSLHQEGILQIYTDTDKWHKVRYQAKFWRRHVFSRSGTCTAVKADSLGLVLARVHFIIEHPELLPDYHVVYANCECVAVWCKTGSWSTLQASSFLEFTTAGQIKSTSTLAAAAAHAQVTVPAAGLWGWLGFTTKASLISVQPWIVPALATYGVATIGAPSLIWAKARRRWEATTQSLSEKFWESALERPDVFAECMTHWSDKA